MEFKPISVRYTHGNSKKSALQENTLLKTTKTVARLSLNVINVAFASTTKVSLIACRKFCPSLNRR